MREIKRRKESIQNIKKITKAMKLVSTVKLQRAKGRTDAFRAYFEKMLASANSTLEKTGNGENRYFNDREAGKNLVILISGNRGLAGGYNANIVRAVLEKGMMPENTMICGIGKKGVEALSRKGYEIRWEVSDMLEEPQPEDAAALGEAVLEAYEKGEIGRIYIAYTHFKNTMTQIPTVLLLLPLPIGKERSDGKTAAPMNFEPDPETVLRYIIPQYINSLIYGAMLESAASENGVRMQAMDSASRNADEMISELSLAYNRARQGTITQELTEIISGAEAIR